MNKSVYLLYNSFKIVVGVYTTLAKAKEAVPGKWKCRVKGHWRNAEFGADIHEHRLNDQESQ